MQGYVANDTALAGQVAARDADIAAPTPSVATVDLARQTDLDRRQALAASGAVSGDELTNAKNQFAEAQAALGPGPGRPRRRRGRQPRGQPAC